MVEEERQREQPSRSNPIVVLLLIAAIAGSLYVVTKGMLFPPNLEALLEPPQLVAQDLGPMDLHWMVRRLDGPATEMTETAGKVVFLNFWEQWCGPCRAELPSIQRLYEQVKGDDILVMPVFQQGPDATRKFLEDSSITMPVYQVMGALPGDVAPGAFPTTYVIGRDGHIVIKEVGAARWDDPSVAEFLRKLASKQ